MKRYMLNTLHDAALTWIILEIGIVISAILYAILGVAGVPGTTSLLIAFLSLVVLILLGMVVFPMVGTGKESSFSWSKLVAGKQEKLLEQLFATLAGQQSSIERLAQSVVALQSNTSHQSGFEQLTSGLLGQQRGVEQLTKSLASQQQNVELLAHSVIDQNSRIVQLAENHADAEHEQIVLLEKLTQRFEQSAHRPVPDSASERIVQSIGQLVKHVETQQHTLGELTLSMMAQQRSLEQLIQTTMAQQSKLEQLTQIQTLPGQEQKFVVGQSMLALKGSEPEAFLLGPRGERYPVAKAFAIDSRTDP